MTRQVRTGLRILLLAAASLVGATATASAEEGVQVKFSKEAADYTQSAILYTAVGCLGGGLLFGVVRVLRRQRSKRREYFGSDVQKLGL